MSITTKKKNGDSLKHDVDQKDLVKEMEGNDTWLDQQERKMISVAAL